MRNIVFIATLALIALAASAVAIPVNQELLLLVDVSGSVDAAEYALQKGGYVNAFNDPGIQAIISGLSNGIAVAYAEWSGAGQQSLEVGWTHVTDAASAAAFAASINAATRNFFGQTAPGSAINWGLPGFTSNNFEGPTWTIDVSGDGSANEGANTFLAAAAANAAGATVNGLAILGEAGLATWYQDNIVTPGGGFLLTANSFADFERAIFAKLEREIIPEPGTLVLLGGGLGLLGFTAIRRRRNRKAA